MDQGRRTLNPNGSHGNPSQSSSLGSSVPSGNRTCTSVTPSDPWHSTPVKKKEIHKMTRQISSPLALTTTTTTTSVQIPQDSQTLGDMENATIQRQRRELQLLVAELKDRDQELNTMAAAHHKQLQAWEQDRQRVLTLEQRCGRLEDELHKRNQVIRAVTKRVHVVESREKESHRDLNSTQQQLHELGRKQQYSSQQCQDLEERNQSLNSTVTSLSVQVGSLQVREEELSAMLRLKDRDVTEATNHIVDLSGRLRESQASLEEHRCRGSRLLRESEEHKRRHREARHENARLKEELQEQVTESSAQREEMIRLKQEGQALRRELASSGERESRKDELLALARSKQERTESELHCLRQVCENRQNDVQLLQLNLESAHEALRLKEGRGSQGRGSAVSESAASQGTERGRGAARRQAMSRSTDHQPDHRAPPFPFLTTESVWASGSNSDLTDVTMAASDLTTRSQSRSTGKKRRSQSSAGRRSTRVYTGSESSCGTVGNRGRESKDSMAACCLATATGSVGQSAARSVTASGNSAASSRPKQLSSDQESKCTNQETRQGGNRTEATAPGSVARTSASSNKQCQVHISDRTASGPTSVSDHAPNYHGQGTLVRITEGDGSMESEEGGVATNPASLSGQAECPGCGCSSTAEMATCGRSNNPSLADGQARPNCGCCGSSSIREGQTAPCSSKAASRGGTCVAETASCICSRVAERQPGPCCGCEASEKVEGNSSGRPPSEAETGAGMGLLAVFNGEPEAEDSSILLLDVSRRASVSVCTCQRDLTCIYLDDPAPSPSPWSRRSPGPANDSASPTTSDYLEDDDQQCSTNRLQRLLDESRQMVASLERTTLRPLSPSHNRDAVLGLGVSRDGGSGGSSHHRHHPANHGSPYHSGFQTHQDSRSPPRGSECLNQPKERSGL